MKTILASLTLGLILLGAAATAPAQTPLATYAIQFSAGGSQQSGAAVVGQAGDYWNLLTSASGTATLQDASNHLSGVSLIWAGSGVYSFAGSAFGGGDANLMGGYLFTTTPNAQTVSFSGLPANRPCVLYIYTQGNWSSGGRQLQVTVNGNTFTATPGVASATAFVAGQNYLCFTNDTDDSGNLSFTYTPYGAENEADINGIQLQLFPNPTDTWVGNTSANFSGLNWTGANNPPISGDALVFGAAGLSGTTLNADQPAGITYAGITFTTNASGYTINGTNGITLTGGITNNNGNAETLNFPINCPNQVTITGSISGNTLGGVISGAGGITLNGNIEHNIGGLTLAGTNTYTGPTLINQGDLYLNGSLAAGSAVTIAADGWLIGQGTAAGTVAVYGLLTPNLGTMNTGPETWYGSQNVLDGYLVYISSKYTGTAGTDWDLVNINGALNIAATSDQPFIIYPETRFLASFTNTQDYTWRIATASGGITGFDPSKFSIRVNPDYTYPGTQAQGAYAAFGSVTSLGAGQFVVTQSGNDLLLQFVHPIANPGTVYRAFGTYMHIPVSAVLTNISDAPGPLTLTSVTSPNPNDYVQISGTNVLFAPANPNEPASILNYSAQLTCGAPATNVIVGTLTVAATNALGISRSITVSNGQAVVSFAGMPGSKYMVQRSINLLTWTNLDGASGLPNSILTNTASTGIWTFTDPNPPLPSAYYRTVQAYFTLLWGGNLNPTYNGNAHTVTASSSPPGMAVSLTYNGSSAAPINAGSYTVVGTIADGNFTGSMTNTLTIAKAAATIAFIDFIWDDNSDLETAIVETDPLGLSVNITSMPDPKNQQYLDVTATITDPNYTGVATAVILIPPANQ
jgi:autotransporter-associated beta strand protein